MGGGRGMGGGMGGEEMTGGGMGGNEMGEIPGQEGQSQMQGSMQGRGADFSIERKSFSIDFKLTANK